MSFEATADRTLASVTKARPSAPLSAVSAGDKPKRKLSGVSTGRRLFVEGDGNSAWSRRYRDLIAGHISDLGGPSALSEAQISLIKRASAIETELEQLEGKLSQGEEINLDEFTRAASHLRRIYETIGLERQARDITPSLHDYIARNHAKPSQDSPAVVDGDDAAPGAVEHTSDVPSGAGV